MVQEPFSWHFEPQIVKSLKSSSIAISNYESKYLTIGLSTV